MAGELASFLLRRSLNHEVHPLDRSQASRRSQIRESTSVCLVRRVSAMPCTNESANSWTSCAADSSMDPASSVEATLPETFAPWLHRRPLRLRHRTRLRPRVHPSIGSSSVCRRKQQQPRTYPSDDKAGNRHKLRRGFGWCSTCRILQFYEHGGVLGMVQVVVIGRNVLVVVC